LDQRSARIDDAIVQYTINNQETTMTNLNEHTHVSQFVTEFPAVARIFERLGIDYCCGGREPLLSACSARGLNVQEVLSDISKFLQRAPEQDRKDLQGLTQAELADHIVALHHQYLRDTLPVLSEQVDRVAMVHGPSRPELLEVRRVFREFAAEMMDHLEKEEQILFPLIAGRGGPMGCSISHIIQVMEAEHDVAGQALLTMRNLTNDYAVPEGACGTYRAVLQGLLELEQDTHIHVHTENHILFPRAVASRN
jgi:regulator of cell morphogenesis and NO signaling